jgi:hypothetical protein
MPAPRGACAYAYAVCFYGMLFGSHAMRAAVADALTKSYEIMYGRAVDQPAPAAARCDDVTVPGYLPRARHMHFASGHH